MIDNVINKKMIKNVLKGRKVANVPQDLKAECDYWAKEFGRKFGAGYSVTQTRRGGCKINWNENWGGYSIEGNEIGNVIVWTSGRDKAANLPREIEKLVKKSRNEARNMFSRETKDWAREITYRYAKEKTMGKKATASKVVSRYLTAISQGEPGVRSFEECKAFAEAFAKNIAAYDYDVWDADGQSHSWFFTISIKPFRDTGGTTVFLPRGRSTTGWEASRENKKALAQVVRGIKSAVRRAPKFVEVRDIEKPKTFAEAQDSWAVDKPQRYYDENKIEIHLKVDRYRSYEEMEAEGYGSFIPEDKRRA